jgi:hypothetical protein
MSGPVHFNAANGISCAGLTVAHYAGDQATWVESGATATFVGCSFTENSISSSYSDSAVLTVQGVSPLENSTLQDTIVRLENCTFTRNVADNVIVKSIWGVESSPTDSAHIYSDDITQKVTLLDGRYDLYDRQAEPLTAVPPGRQGINGTSEWFQRIQTVCSFLFCLLDRSCEVIGLQA